jgi:hypothetical protein
MVERFQRERYADAATARRYLEQCEWDLERAMERYMPPVPESEVSDRTLATSSFKEAYGNTEAPEGPMDLGAVLSDHIQAYCTKLAIPWKQEGLPFLKKLQREAMRNMDDPIDGMMQRMWTSALQLRGKEFCFILNDALRGDNAELADSMAGLADSRTGTVASSSRVGSSGSRRTLRHLSLLPSRTASSPARRWQARSAGWCASTPCASARTSIWSARPTWRGRRSTCSLRESVVAAALRLVCTCPCLLEWCVPMRCFAKVLCGWLSLLADIRRSSC